MLNTIRLNNKSKQASGKVYSMLQLVSTKVITKNVPISEKYQNANKLKYIERYCI